MAAVRHYGISQRANPNAFPTRNMKALTTTVQEKERPINAPKLSKMLD